MYNPWTPSYTKRSSYNMWPLSRRLPWEPVHSRSQSQFDNHSYSHQFSLNGLLWSQNFLPLRSTWVHPVFVCRVRITRSLVLWVCFAGRCLSFCTFSWGHCVVCSWSIYGFWLPLWHLQILLPRSESYFDNHSTSSKFSLDGLL